jgi:aryl-alcohol dehydrogenase-like predicted oxidoreductase
VRRCMSATDRVPPSVSGLPACPIGVGAMSWGARVVGYGSSYGFDDVLDAYRACQDAGVDYFDTAQMYGSGESERVLGECQRRDGRAAFIATKFAPYTLLTPNRAHAHPQSLVTELDRSLDRLGTARVDLYQLHMPPARKKLDGFLVALAETVRTGRARAVGVCNFTAPLVRLAHERLAAEGVPLASAMAGYNLLRRYPETNGVLQACRELDIAFIAYAPLAEGVLTGKYRGGERVRGAYRLLFRLEQFDPHGERGTKRRWWRGITRPRTLETVRLEPLFCVLEDIAATREKTIAQVALNWLLTAEPRVIPIPGVRNLAQAKDNLGAIGWWLTDAERQRICEAETAC